MCHNIFSNVVVTTEILGLGSMVSLDMPSPQVASQSFQVLEVSQALRGTAPPLSRAASISTSITIIWGALASSPAAAYAPALASSLSAGYTRFRARSRHPE